MAQVMEFGSIIRMNELCMSGIPSSKCCFKKFHVCNDLLEILTNFDSAQGMIVGKVLITYSWMDIHKHFWKQSNSLILKILKIGKF
jgi:hypothetical protein